MKIEFQRVIFSSKDKKLNRVCSSSSPAIWFLIRAMKAYLIGEMYSIQEIQTGRSSRFLKKPLKRMKGMMKTGTTMGTSWASDIALPINMPIELPAKLIRTRMKQKVKNWPAVLASPIIQYMMAEQMRGVMTSRGSSTRKYDRKKVMVLQRPAPSSLRKMILSRGNTIETGERVLIMPPIPRKKSRPARVQKSTLAKMAPFWFSMQSSFWLMAKQTPPTKRPRMMAWMSFDLRMRGFLMMLITFFFMMAPSLWQKPTVFLVVSISCLFFPANSLRIMGACSFSQVAKYLGQFATFWADSWCIMDMKQSGGLENSGQARPIFPKYSIAMRGWPWQMQRPSTIRISLSKRRKMSELGWWMVISTVLLWLCASFLRQLQMMKAVRESSPEVGSSNTITRGSLMISKATDVLFFSPPEMPLIMLSPTSVSLQLSSFSSFISLITAHFLSASGLSIFKAATYSRVSCTVSVASKISCCMMQFAKSLNFENVQSSLLAKSFPQAVPSGASASTWATRQPMMLRRVVFPAPEAPIMAVTSLPLATPEIPSKIVLLSYFFLQGSTQPSCFTSTSTEKLIFSKQRSILSFLATGVPSFMRRVYDMLSDQFFYFQIDRNQIGLKAKIGSEQRIKVN